MKKAFLFILIFAYTLSFPFSDSIYNNLLKQKEFSLDIGYRNYIYRPSRTGFYDGYIFTGLYGITNNFQIELKEIYYSDIGVTGLGITANYFDSTLFFRIMYDSWDYGGLSLTLGLGASSVSESKGFNISCQFSVRPSIYLITVGDYLLNLQFKPLAMLTFELEYNPYFTCLNFGIFPLPWMAVRAGIATNAVNNVFIIGPRETLWKLMFSFKIERRGQ